MNSIGVSRDINSGYSTRLTYHRLGSTMLVRQQTLTSVVVFCVAGSMSLSFRSFVVHKATVFGST